MADGADKDALVLEMTALVVSIGDLEHERDMVNQEYATMDLEMAGDLVN